MLARLRKGVQLKMGLLISKKSNLRVAWELTNGNDVTLMEGRNREVRRLWESQGIQVSRLIRIRYGNIKLMKGFTARWLGRNGFGKRQLFT